MSDIEKARQLFRNAGLAFPAIPSELAARLRELDQWLFSTREIEMSPYNLQHYLFEVSKTHVEDYAVLSHSGHGINSYAVQYYLVHSGLQMFLHLGWGGVYMDAHQNAATVSECFSLADAIVTEAERVATSRTTSLLIVGSDFYGSIGCRRERSAYRKTGTTNSPPKPLPKRFSG
jgi:hypothetical protein